MTQVTPCARSRVMGPAPSLHGGPLSVGSNVNGWVIVEETPMLDYTRCYHEDCRRRSAIITHQWALGLRAVQIAMEMDLSPTQFLHLVVLQSYTSHFPGSAARDLFARCGRYNLTDWYSKSHFLQIVLMRLISPAVGAHLGISRTRAFLWIQSQFLVK